jgi:hypothetical protein
MLEFLSQKTGEFTPESVFFIENNMPFGKRGITCSRQKVHGNGGHYFQNILK